MTVDPRASDAPSRRLVLILIGILCLIWGSTWVVISVGLDHLPPFTSSAARFFIAALAMVALAPRLHRAEGGRRPATSLWFLLGVTNYFVSYSIVYWVETRLDSGLVALIWAIYPLMMAGVGWFMLPEERLAPAGFVGLLAGFAGVGLLLGTDVTRLGEGSIVAGLLLLASPFVSAIGTALVKRAGKDVSSVLLNRNALFVGALGLGAGALAFERDQAVAWTPTAVLSVCYLAVFGTVIAFGIYFWLLRHTSANELSVIAYLAPVIAIFLGAVVKGETVTPWTLVGAGLIFGGVALSRRSPATGRPRRKGGAEDEPLRKAA